MSGPGSFGLVLVKSGAFRWGEGEEAAIHPAGSLLLLPPGLARPFPSDDQTELATVHFGRSVVDGFQASDAAGLVVGLLASDLPVSARFATRHMAGLASAFQDMEEELANQGLAWRTMVGLKLLELLVRLARARQVAQPGRGATGLAAATMPLRFRPDEARAFIQAHCGDALTLAGLAARYGMNPSYFSRLFHAKTGMAVVECINQARIQKSCLLLKRTQAGILEIATAVGYNSLSHFNKYFRRIVGMSPRDWRKRSQK